MTPPRQYSWRKAEQLQGKAPFPFMDECQICDRNLSEQVFKIAPGLVTPAMPPKNVYGSNAVRLPTGPVKTSMQQAAPAPSTGSMGHPFSCGESCKYFRRKGGCRDGINCQKCHLCYWSRDSTQRKPIVQDSTPLRIAIPDESTDDTPPSVGSIGHPFTCNVACKYHSKKAGCKDGKLCSRCHLCRWSRCCEKFNGEGKVRMPLAFEHDVIANTAAFEANKIMEVEPPPMLPSPRRVEISRRVENQVPMYISVAGNTSF
jgi:hypothetical protein